MESPSPNDSRRRLKDHVVSGLCLFCVVLALVPLISILYEVTRRGLPAINIAFLTQTPGIIGQSGGGIAPAIEGTLILVAVASLIGVPIGVLAGVYVSEFGDNNLGRSIDWQARTGLRRWLLRFVSWPLIAIGWVFNGRTIRFLNDVLTEFPSIVVGILAYTLIVLVTRSYSALAGAAALSVIMMPIVARTTEESLKVVPTTVRDAAAALGVRRWRSTLSVVLTTGKNGVITGVLLSVARIAGETAPLILTVLGSSLFVNINVFDLCTYNIFATCNPLRRPIDALPLRIYRYALLPYPDAIQQGWGAALVLILMVLSINIIVRVATRGKLYGGKRF
jgi:phosphate transport system permease protein